MAEIPDTELTELRERVARLEDVGAIEAVIYRYARAANSVEGSKDLDGIRSCFTDGGRWRANQPGNFHDRTFGDFSGAAEIRQYFAESELLMSLHYVTNPRIAVDTGGDSATGRFMLIGFNTMPAPAGARSPHADPVSILGEYEARFVKVERAWLIDELVVDIRYISVEPA